jgi:hypothetical protein
MMRRTLFGAAAVAILLLLGTSRPVAAQGLASLAAVPAGSSMTLEKKPGCWECITLIGFGVCAGGASPGYFNCVGTTMAGTCIATSPGCGGSAMMPLDPDGATQLVSRGSLLGIPVAVLPGDPDVRRNCDGVVVARLQSPDDITEVRARTGTLTL